MHESFSAALPEDFVKAIPDELLQVAVGFAAQPDCEFNR